MSCTILVGAHCILSQPLKAPLNSKLFQVEGDSTKAKNVTTADTLMDLLRNSFPPNIIQATMQQYKTEIIYPGEENVSRLFFMWIINCDCHDWNMGSVLLIWYWMCGLWRMALNVKSVLSFKYSFNVTSNDYWRSRMCILYDHEKHA